MGTSVTLGYKFWTHRSVYVFGRIAQGLELPAARHSRL